MRVDITTFNSEHDLQDFVKFCAPSLWARVCNDPEKKIDPDFPDFFAAYLTERLEDPHDLVIARFHGKYVGHIFIGYPPEITPYNNRAQVLDFMVTEKFRGKGVADELWAEALSRIKEKGVGEIECFINDFNLRLGKLAKMSGFISVGELLRYRLQ